MTPILYFALPLAIVAILPRGGRARRNLGNEVAVSNSDKIGETQLEAIFKRHRWGCFFGSGLALSFIQYKPSVEEHSFQTVFDAEAPQDQFDFEIYGHRRFGSRAVQWITLTGEEAKNPLMVPFTLKSLESALNFGQRQLDGMRYAPRCYLGPDLRYHVGFDVELSTRVTIWKCQVMENGTLPSTLAGKQFPNCKLVAVWGDASASPIKSSHWGLHREPQ